MKNEILDKKLTTVEALRIIRDRINADIQDLSKPELVKYFNQQKTLYPAKTWKKIKTS